MTLAVEWPHGGPVTHAEVGDWDAVERAIVNVVRDGGEVRLDAVSEVDDRSYQVHEMIWIVAEPGEFQLVVAPKEGDLRTLCSGGEFGGVRQFYHNEDDSDLRTILTDVQMAKDLFWEFFNNVGVSPKITEQTQTRFD